MKIRPVSPCASAVMAVCVICAGAAPGAAEVVNGIGTPVSQPIAVRGGVLMLPLTARQGGDHWPATLEIELESGRRLVGQVAWLHMLAAPAERRWTHDPRLVGVRAIEASDDTSGANAAGREGAAASALGPYLLALIPPDVEGAMKLGEQTLRPRWHDRPDLTQLKIFHEGLSDPAEAEAGAVLGAAPGAGPAATLMFTDAIDRPDPYSPFEYWRWVLLADRLKLAPPDPRRYGEIGSLVAEHIADLWRIGMQRLAGRDRELARRCVLALTQIGSDHLMLTMPKLQPLNPPQSFAAWVEDPSAEAALLAALLDESHGVDRIINRARQWLDTRPPLLWWPEDEAGDVVRLALVKRMDNEGAVMRWSWPDHPGSRGAVIFVAGELLRLPIDRPPRPEAPLPGLPAPQEPTPRQLVMEVEGRRWPVLAGPRVVTAQPPGVRVGPLRPLLTLAEVELGQQRLIDPDHATTVEIRRMRSRWEVFFECRRPAVNGWADEGGEQAGPEGASIQGGGALGARQSWTDTAGIEAVTLLIGPTRFERGPMVALTAPEVGAARVFRGSGSEAELEVHRRSYADRWYCRIVLPEAWIVPGAGGGAPSPVALFGFARTHGDNAAIETGPNATVPWRMDPGRVAVDLGAWRDGP